MRTSYTVWQEGCEDDKNDFDGVFSEDEAAQAGAELFGEGEAGEPMTVFVKCPKGKVSKWKVYSEVKYTAQQVVACP